jgi:hypothetical protein
VLLRGDYGKKKMAPAKKIWKISRASVVILATQEAKIRKIEVRSQSG